MPTTLKSKLNWSISRSVVEAYITCWWLWNNKHLLNKLCVDADWMWWVGCYIIWKFNFLKCYIVVILIKGLIDIFTFLSNLCLITVCLSAIWCEFCMLQVYKEVKSCKNFRTRIYCSFVHVCSLQSMYYFNVNRLSLGYFETCLFFTLHILLLLISCVWRIEIFKCDS